jgi:hypothetical protein
MTGAFPSKYRDRERLPRKRAQLCRCDRSWSIDASHSCAAWCGPSRLAGQSGWVRPLPSDDACAFGTPELALAAYNAGPNAVARYGGIPPLPRSPNHVRRVMAVRDRLTGAS